MSQNLGIKIRNVTNQKNALNQTKIKKLSQINTIKFQKNTRELSNKANLQKKLGLAQGKKFNKPKIKIKKKKEEKTNQLFSNIRTYTPVLENKRKYDNSKIKFNEFPENKNKSNELIEKKIIAAEEPFKVTPPLSEISNPNDIKNLIEGISKIQNEFLKNLKEDHQMKIKSDKKFIENLVGAMKREIVSAIKEGNEEANKIKEKNDKAFIDNLVSAMKKENNELIHRILLAMKK